MSYFIGKFLDKFREINTATLTGAIDVIVVEQPDGTFTCSPFHVRFGKMGVLRSKEKIVEIEINGNPANIHMKLGDSGEAFFVQPVDLDEDGIIPPHLTCSPIPLDDHYMESIRNVNHNLLLEPKAKKSIEFLRKPPIDEIKSVGSGKSDENIYVFDQAHQSTSNENIEQNEKEVAVITELSESEREVKKDEEDESENKNESSETDNEELRRSESHIALPKTFSAETITENVEMVRKISAATAEFRPIEVETNEAPKTEDKPLVHSNSKRRRKKRASAKKKSSVTKRPASLELKVEEEAKTLPDVSQEDPELANVKYSAMESDLHFFSDTEVTAGHSETLRPRPPSVELASVLSDSEVEMKRGIASKPHQQSWNWGELPSPPPLNFRGTDADSNQQEAAVKRSLLASLMGFMKRTKHMRHSPQSEGIYLSDLDVNALEPHIAQLYFGSNYKQLEGAPHSDASGQRGGSTSSGESGRGASISGSPNSVPGSPAGPVLPMGEVVLSLCGKLGTPEGPSDEEFAQHVLSYETLSSDPGILDNPDLVVRIEGKYYSWRAASPIILSWVAYQKPLPKEVVEKITPPQETPELPERKRTRSYSSWFSWKRGGTETSPEKANLDVSDSKKDISNSSIQEDSILATMAEILNQIPEITDQAVSSDSDEDMIRNKRGLNANHKKTLRLTSEQIAGLELRSGMNEVEFSVTTAYQGTTRCKCYLFKWRWNDKIVISDIDGTITKSDVLGHVLPIMGKDWAQNGVTRLFTKIKENGYKLLYLSARAIGQSRVTREYLQSVKQEDLTLPEGPMLLNPTSLLNAFHTEVIEKKPQEFKISCLRDIMALFPPNTQPFYAGYGNKVNDVWSYQAVGIPLSRIFTINSRGEVKHEMTQTFQSTYSNMSYLVDQMFPSSLEGTSSEDFSQFVYWREPICETLPEDTI
ncbi:phosphatidate phosphatase LPIN3 isoform X3 [Diaphorina citri]|uniref:phosphatidate phosphatase n=1 Tax=Diaphorina citri TaxID=121845 RepID=A0A1S4EM11_DIACI|nr:phosphatidate phosphatase LPIN3 isoform X2 [Diaphorina citri]XP_026685836.1 phosphatidate phosphatase LPIN3 isoform X1 [Diaphorina citri]XP_026685837.1 phosphatidate phosphatase LPIN3 isoform X3 [Diaphorina citri]